MWYQIHDLTEQRFHEIFNYDNLVKTLNVGWLSKKLHMQCA